MKSSFVFLTGALSVACLSQASLSAQAPSLLFSHDYDISVFFGGVDIINLELPSGSRRDTRTGVIELDRVARIDSVSIEINHDALSEITFLLIPPGGNFPIIVPGLSVSPTSNVFFLINGAGDGALGTGLGSRNHRTYNFTESTGGDLNTTPFDVGSDRNSLPGGDYRAVSWPTAPQGGWAPGRWLLHLRDWDGNRGLGGVGRIEIRGVLLADVIPEPSSFALLMGLCAFAGIALRRRSVSGSKH